MIIRLALNVYYLFNLRRENLNLLATIMRRYDVFYKILKSNLFEFEVLTGKSTRQTGTVVLPL